MEHGQLGTDFQRRFIFIWEGTVADLAPSKIKQERRAQQLRRWDKAVSLWQVYEMAVVQFWHLNARTLLYLDLAVTSRGRAFTQAVARYIEVENLPIRHVFPVSAERLGRRLAYMPDVERVFYSRDEQRYCFGPKGFRIPEANRGLSLLS